MNWHAGFQQFVNDSGVKQWKCIYVIEGKIPMLVLPMSKKVYINVGIRPRIGFCKKPQYYI